MADEDKGRVRELEKEVIDLKITNRGKDYFIEQLQKEREGFAEERKGYVDELMKSQKQVGELEAKLLQLGAPDVQKHLGPAGEGSL
jgi:polyhydroxyalkanoate synthesis regulator phasin